MTDIERGHLAALASQINQREVDLMAEVARLRSLVSALQAANSEKDEALSVLIEDKATPERDVWRDGANTLAQRNGSIAQTFRTYTYSELSQREAFLAGFAAAEGYEWGVDGPADAYDCWIKSRQQ